MSRIENSLARLESALRGIIEGNPVADGVPRKFHNQLMTALTRAMQSAVNEVRGDREVDEGTYTAPDQYILVLPEESARTLLAHPAELDRLAHKLASYAAQANIRLEALPIMRVVARPGGQELTVHTQFSRVGIDDSSTTELEEANPAGRIPGNGNSSGAFLIVNGLNTYPLAQAVTNIGSDPANQLVLSDPGVSRSHAQLRFINNRYTIFDLGSRAGSFVNGVKISSQVLKPGDVILLASVPLVYGQETGEQMGYTQEISIRETAYRGLIRVKYSRERNHPARFTHLDGGAFVWIPGSGTIYHLERFKKPGRIISCQATGTHHPHQPGGEPGADEKLHDSGDHPGA